MNGPQIRSVASQIFGVSRSDEIVDPGQAQSQTFAKVVCMQQVRTEGP